MDSPGPYIPSTRNRIGARIEWLAAVALFEAASAAAEYRRITIAAPWQTEPNRWGPGCYEIWDRKAYERLRNAEARDLCDGMQNAAHLGYAASRGAWHVEQGSDAWQQLFGPRPYWP